MLGEDANDQADICWQEDMRWDGSEEEDGGGGWTRAGRDHSFIQGRIEAPQWGVWTEDKDQRSRPGEESWDTGTRLELREPWEEKRIIVILLLLRICVSIISNTLSSS